MSGPLPGLQGASWANVLVRCIGAALSLAVAMVLARWLGPDGFGTYAWAMALVTVLGVVARLGLPNILVRDIPVLRDRGDTAGLVGLARFAPRTAGLAAAGIGAVTWGALAAAGAEATALRTVAVALAVLVLFTLTDMYAAILRGLHAAVETHIPHQVVRPAVLAVGVGLAWWVAAPDPALAMALQAVAAAVGLGAALALVRWHWPAAAGAAGIHTPRRWLAAALPMLLLAGLGALNRHTDILMLDALATDRDVGFYAAAAQLAGLTQFVLTSFNVALAPRFASRHAEGDVAGLQRLATRGASAVAVATLPLAALLVLASGPLLGLYGPDFPVARPALVVLTAGYLGNALAGSVGYLLAMTGHERVVAVVLALAWILNVGLDLWLIPRWGPTGAAVGTAAGMLLWNGVLVVAVHRLLGIDPTALGALRRREPR